MTRSFSHRVWNSVNRLRNLPRSRSPYDQVPYTGSPLLNPSPVDALSTLQVNWLRHDTRSADVQGSHRAFGDAEKLSAYTQSFGWLFRRTPGNCESRTIFKASPLFIGSSGNSRLKLALPCEHRGRGRSALAEKQWQASATHALFKRVPDVVANANGGSEFQQATVRGIERSIQMVSSGSFVKGVRLNANSAGSISEKEVPAERSTLPFMDRYSRHMPQMNNLGTYKSQTEHSLTERLVNPFPYGNTWSPKFSVASSNLGADSILHNAGRVTKTESPFSTAGLQVGPQSGRIVERGPSAATSRDVSFRDRLKRAVTAIGTNTSVIPRIAVNAGLESSQTLSPGDFSADVSKPDEPAVSISVTPGRSRPASHTIVRPPENEQSSRFDDLAPNDFEKKRAARMNARPRRMLPRIR